MQVQASENFLGVSVCVACSVFSRDMQDLLQWDNFLVVCAVYDDSLPTAESTAELGITQQYIIQWNRFLQRWALHRQELYSLVRHISASKDFPAILERALIKILFIFYWRMIGKFQMVWHIQINIQQLRCLPGICWNYWTLGWNISWEHPLL